MLMNCGEARLVRPSMGSWVTYGLGSENQNMPGFITMCPGGYPIQESQNWQAGFLPGVYQGTYIDTKHTELDKLIENIRNGYVSSEGAARAARPAPAAQRSTTSASGRTMRNSKRACNPSNSPTACRWMRRMPSTSRASRRRIREMYGDGVQGRQMLIARRLLERGVRFVQVWHGAGQPWDSHDEIEKNHRRLAGECDQAIGALAQRSQAARHARRHARHLGRRIRPHADRGDCRRRARTMPA